jgi:hypothetical protein
MPQCWRCGRTISERDVRWVYVRRKRVSVCPECDEAMARFDYVIGLGIVLFAIAVTVLILVR